MECSREDRFLPSAAGLLNDLVYFVKLARRHLLPTATVKDLFRLVKMLENAFPEMKRYDLHPF